MSTQSLIELSSTSLYLSFLIYLIAILPWGLSVKSKRSIFSRVALLLTLLGFILQLIYFISRWYVSGHAPVSNLYEFMTFFGIMLVGSFFILYYIYRQSVMGLFILPISLIILGYANAFSKEISPLIPALQSEWLTIHVITVAFSSAVLSISFVTGLIYLLKTINPKEKSKKSFFLELIMYFIIVVIGFITITTAFQFTNYKQYIKFTNKQDQIEIYEYTLPALTVPKNSVIVESRDSKNHISQKNSVIETPLLIDAQKLNTIIWSFLTGTLIYLVIRLICRCNVISLIKPVSKKVNANLMDEITYRSVVIGFPLFALGGLVFAMIWAQLAWSRFWGWDPKEVWALITFLFYSVLLHLRIGKGWEGERTAWMAIIGFGIIIFNQVFVNLIISGLHSYA
ncbi:c-type cytochrome biogenesis protein CcsB [Heyndrickxia oleronia]|uniref:C-type cytochrome biogenesis protein CcsB n=1 Tax=Heyndrickxia oleronia TaxID=38875 RepID=A0A8E2LB92_9BACI|nr:c-type cytochrome biogenesis protein CcsB [Heyndrickxia oleronia]MEC1376662.1 c-type cytochrome biogenesis protein CcsB [Heyndrickxia oleronia]OOP65527.1 c-type cytochrome biogenesis protein CcsB [Heyndrickxia oleronia]QQZ02902.1 c-type cytochrome biogenesis protein CcsB [Heyndrickxia oleronia]